jgi:short-subunit dehydrogenase
LDWKTRYGPWALVTGASAGLGAEFARQIAARGVHVCIVARRKERLEALAGELAGAHGVQVRPIQADLTAEGACASVIEQTADLDIGLLVNNAGFGLSGYYHRLDPDAQVSMTVLNCVVPVLLTNRFLPPMVDRGRGGIIFLASTAAYQATPSFSVYGATKAFNLMLGEGLWKEYAARGVDVLAVSPGFTATEFLEVAHISHAGPLPAATPESVVAASLRNLGRRPSFVHGLVNKCLNFLVRLMPRRIVVAVTHAILSGRTKSEP